MVVVVVVVVGGGRREGEDVRSLEYHKQPITVSYSLLLLPLLLLLLLLLLLPLLLLHLLLLTAVISSNVCDTRLYCPAPTKAFISVV